jgi:hypothetical protein
MIDKDNFEPWNDPNSNYVNDHMKAQFSVKDKRHAMFRRWCKSCGCCRYQLIRTEETLFQCAICDRFVCAERQNLSNP